MADKNQLIAENMPNKNNDLSPWAHPKAQRWFATLLERSGFISEIEDTVQLDDDHLDLPHGRMMLALLILLGRNGIWPEEKKRVLQRAASRISKLASQGPAAPIAQKKKHRPLTLAQHKRNTVAQKAIQVELEFLRRRAGMSNRTSKLTPPVTWKNFWV